MLTFSLQALIALVSISDAPFGTSKERPAASSRVLQGVERRVEGDKVGGIEAGQVREVRRAGRSLLRGEGLT